MTTVFDHFKQRLGIEPDDETLRELPCDSTCGADCVGAIDAGALLMRHVSVAHGDDHTMHSEIVAIVFDVVSVYWRG